MVPRTLLIVDDGPACADPMRAILPSVRILCDDGDGAVSTIRTHRPPVTLLPLRAAADAPEPEASRMLDRLTAVLTASPATKVIVLARPQDRRLAARAVARGAHDVCRLPPDPAEIAAVVERAFHRADLELEGRSLSLDDAPPTLRAVRDDVELRALRAALARADGNLSAAARLLAISRPTLYSLLRQHRLKTD